MSKIKVGVTGTGSLVGQAIIKSLLKSKLKNQIDLIGFDYIKGTVGSYWTNKHYLLPDFFLETVTRKEWLEKLVDIIRHEQINILFIGIDFELELFATFKRTIETETECKVIVSDLNVIEISNDKYMTYSFLKENNFYFPETLLPNELEGTDIKFPCILKSRTGSSGKNVFIAKDMQDLHKKISYIKDPIIQELVGNPQREYTCGVICLENEVKEMIVLRRDLENGNTQNAYFSKKTPKIIYDYIYKIARALKPFGVCNFQLRLDVDGIPRLFEINARHSGTTYIRTYFGFKEVEYILAYFLNGKPPKFNLKEGLVKRYFSEMFIPNR